MILTGAQIREEWLKGTININPFNESNLNPNSYNLTMDNHLLAVRTGVLLDSKKDNKEHYYEQYIPDDGLMLVPGKLYLGSTVETTSSNHFIPMLEGRSSIARLGMCVHLTAGVGDLGFSGSWTLEITVVNPLIIYPRMKVCQLVYHKPYGDLSIKYRGKYQFQDIPTRSRLWSELQSTEM